MATRAFFRVLLLSLPGSFLFLPSSRAADQRPVVAVFDIEDTRTGKAKLPPQKLRSLTDYLANKLAIGGRFKIVPRASIRKAILAKKKESFKECFDSACQIEIGREIAAQKSLATRIDQLGGECIVTSTLFDLRQSATENSASYRGPCGGSEMLTAIEQIAARLRGDKGGGASKKGIRFDTSNLPTVPTLEMPSGGDASVSGVDFGDVDVDAMELFDTALQAEKNEGVPAKKKIERWQKVKKAAPKYRKHATARIIAWEEYARKQQQITAIQKKRAAKLMKDWKKLARLLKLKMISNEDKDAWKEAFYSAYHQETRINPFAQDSDVVGFVDVLTKKKRNAEEAEKIRKLFTWVRSSPTGLDFMKSEVTVAQYRSCVKAGKCTEPKAKSDHKYCNWGYGDRDKHPINCVDWNQAKLFCDWVGGRLPTEREWEAEASNKGSRTYPWGEEKPTCDRVVMVEGGWGCGRNSTWPVCSKARGNSVSGLCDMGGNLWEWTFSLYNAGNPARVVRGGSLRYGSAENFHASRRLRSNSTIRSRGIGLRCVRESQ